MLKSHEILENIPTKTKEEFVRSVYDLIDELKNNPTGWQNDTIESYLEALAGCSEDFEGYYLNRGQPVPENIEWGIFAHLLESASVYD